MKFLDCIDGILVFLVLDEGILGLDVQVLDFSTLVEQLTDALIAHAPRQTIHIQLSVVVIVLRFAVWASTSWSTIPLTSISTPNDLRASRESSTIIVLVAHASLASRASRAAWTTRSTRAT